MGIIISFVTVTVSELRPMRNIEFQSNTLHVRRGIVATQTQQQISHSQKYAYVVAAEHTDQMTTFRTCDSHT